jgi:dihydropteroate synthase
MQITLRGHTLDLARKSCVMGILNMTPDSFYDGGRHTDVDDAVRLGEAMMADGADIIDVGGESTRPASVEVTSREEIGRIAPVVERLVRSLGVPISIDTRKAAVAKEMLALGAHMINDVSGLTFDPDMIKVVRDYDVPVVIMHMRGVPQTMQEMTTYKDVVSDVKRELVERVQFAEASGIRPENIVIDPGIGFAKTPQQNIEIIGRLDEFAEIGKPILIGPSMKSFIGRTLGLEPARRLEATIACCVLAAAKGAGIFRVHDVAAVSKALAMADLIRQATGPEPGRVGN